MSFAALVLMLDTMFSEQVVSEAQYHEVVRCMRDYDAARQSPEVERAVLAEAGWPSTYHPCDHMERIRFFVILGGESNETLQHLLDAWAEARGDRWTDGPDWEPDTEPLNP